MTPEQKKLVCRLAHQVANEVISDLASPDVNAEGEYSNSDVIEVVLDADRLEDCLKHGWPRHKTSAEFKEIETALVEFRKLAISTQNRIIREGCGRWL